MKDQSEIDEDDRIPRRKINKQEAVRHLLHTSIRLVMKMEDPFAIHMLVQSAEKLLIDIAKKQSKLLRVDMEDYIKPEFHTAFFNRHRATYNYFKHADKDFADDLPVHDIMMLNVLQLFMTASNYIELFKETTDHMLLFFSLVFHLSPQIIRPETSFGTELLKTMKTTEYMTPQSFFEAFENNSHMLPRFWSEASKDMEDVIDFYHLTFVELRAGEKKSRRLLRIPK